MLSILQPLSDANKCFEYIVKSNDTIIEKETQQKNEQKTPKQTTTLVKINFRILVQIVCVINPLTTQIYPFTLPSCMVGIARLDVTKPLQ